MKCLKKLLLLFLLSCTFMFCIPVLSNNSFAYVTEESFSGELDSTVVSKINKFMTDNNYSDYIFCYGSYLYNCNILVFFNAPEDAMFYEEYGSSYGYYYLKSNTDITCVIYHLVDFLDSVNTKYCGYFDWSQRGCCSISLWSGSILHKTSRNGISGCKSRKNRGR